MVFSKNRRKEVVEIEEEPEFVKVHGYSQKLRVISLDEWKKGCPEGDEQFDLVSLYSQLGERDCYCPKRCGFKVKRNKADLFAIHVCLLSLPLLYLRFSMLRFVTTLAGLYFLYSLS